MKTEKQYRNEKKKGMTRMLLWVAVFALMTSSFISCVDNDDDIPMNYYSSTKVTAAGFLTENIDQFSEFVGILKRTPYFSLLSTYGEYTLFAPNNEAISRYLKKMGYGSIDAIPTESCDTLARTHIIKKGAFFTTDISEGALPELNMDDAYIVLSSDSDVNNNNALVYYINKNARILERDDSVTNGVVHVLNNVITSSSLLLADKIAEDSTLTLFSQALQLTGMADSLVKYIDEKYSCSEDSVHKGVMVRCTSGSAL
ncbi:MAG: fasciclin domain-containing protein, partial [Prevotella sp.]|nr:fasciclin domain-containing protein [Prevotella sp.]